MDSNQKPTADRIRPFLQAMERSIDSARQKRTNTVAPIRTAGAPTPMNHFTGNPASMQAGQRPSPQVLTTNARPPQATSTAPLSANAPLPGVYLPQSSQGEVPGKLKARRKDADAIPPSSFQAQRKAG